MTITEEQESYHYINSSEQEFLKLLSEKDIRYVLIGGHAVNYYGHHRVTRDLDILIDRTPENVERLLGALRFMRIDIPADASVRLLQTRVKMPLPRLNIDVLTSIDWCDLSFENMYSERNKVAFDFGAASLVSFEHLLHMKSNSEREKDQQDYKALLSIQSDQSGREDGCSHKNK